MPEPETDSVILNRMGVDAQKWSQQFLATSFQVMVDRGTDIARDEATMTAWFANAIEAGRAQGRRGTCPHVKWTILADDLAGCMNCGKLADVVDGLVVTSASEV